MRRALLALDALEKAAQRRIISSVARHHLVAQRQSLGRHHQCDDYLHTVRPVVARVSMAALVIFRKRRIGLKIGTG
jgi:hypothetical protein